MGVIALKVDFSISCFNINFKNTNGSNNAIGIIRLEFPFTMEIVGCEEMLLKISGLYHFDSSIDDLCLKTYCLILHLQSH